MFALMLLLITMETNHPAAMPQPPPATCTVAAKTSSEHVRSAAQFVCDGEGDQEEINQPYAAVCYATA
jgi:hypothetical protein